MPTAARRHARGGDGKRRFDANFASRAYRIETVVCYPWSCDGGIPEPIAPYRVDAGARAAPQCRYSSAGNTLLTTKRNRQYVANFFERFNPIEISDC
jgi:hypothetical protein